MRYSLIHILLICFLAGAAFGQYPATGNKSRLGYQTTGDGLIYRGTLADTSSIKPATLSNAYFLLDTVNAVLYRYIKTNGGWSKVEKNDNLLHVLSGGANSAGLSISNETTIAEAYVIVDNSGATVWDGLRVVAYTTTRTRDEVTLQGSGLISITESPAAAGGTINIASDIPPGYVTYPMLTDALKDSIATDVNIQQGGFAIATIIVDDAGKTVWGGLNIVGILETVGTEGEIVLTVDGKTVTFQIGSNLNFTNSTDTVTLLNNQGTDVVFKAGENVTLIAQNDTLTISAPISLSVSQGTQGNAVAIVDDNGATVWDGVRIVSYFAERSVGVTLTINNESVTFYPVQDGNKGDVTVTENGETWNLNNGVVEWPTLADAVKDSIQKQRINPVDSLQFITTYEGSATTPGKVIWNAQSGTLHLGMSDGIEMPIGQGEAHMVRNVTGTTIAKGKVVYISGATGQRPEITLADADAEMSSSVTFGITAQAIANNDTGFVFTSGYVHGINTSTLTEGEALYLDTVAGGFTHDKPQAPIHSVLVGYVITKKNNGTVFVKIQNGYELGELHDVSTQGKAAQDILRYNGTIWQPGKDTSLYNMDARLKGNRLVSMGTADLQFREQAGGADFVQIRPTYVSVENTSTTNNAVLTQYGLQSGSGVNPNNVLSQVYLNGEFSVYTNTAAKVPGTAPDLYIDGFGRTRFRVSAAGTLDSLYGKNATGELMAIKQIGTSQIDTLAVTTAKIATGAVTGAKLGSMTSAQLSGAVTDETGTGAAVFASNPVFGDIKINSTLSNLTGILNFSNSGNNKWGLNAAGNNATDFYIINWSDGNNRAFYIKESNSFVGLYTNDPQRRLHVKGKVRIDSLDNGTATKIVGATNDGDLDSISIGTGLALTSGTLSAKPTAYFTITMFSPDDTVKAGTSKDFIVIPASLNGYCMDSYQIRAFSGTGSIDVQIKSEGVTFGAQSMSGTTNYSVNANTVMYSGNRFQIETLNRSGNLFGLSATFEFNATCN